MDELREWYEPDGDPREALGRYARRLRGGGALYLGGGIGVEAVSRRVNNERVESYALVPGGEKFDGPLSAVTAAFTAAGKSTSVDTPGGAKAVGEASIAARLHELDASEREERATIVRYEARAARRAKMGAVAYTAGTMVSDDSWELRRMEEARANLTAIAAERTRLMSGKLSESVVRLRVPSLPLAVEASTARGVSLLAGEEAVRERQLNARGDLHGDDGKFTPKERAQDRAPSITQTIAKATEPREGDPQHEFEPVAETGLIGAMMEAQCSEN